jgi:hypothetical protein
MRDRSPELLQALVDDEDLEGLLQIVTMDEVADAWCPEDLVLFRQTGVAKERRLVHRSDVPMPVASGGFHARAIDGAVVTHARRSEYPNVAANLALAAMAVTWGRFGPHAF